MRKTGERLALPESKYSTKEFLWFKEVFDLYYENIRNFTYYKTSDIPFADDVVLETFLKLWSFREKVRVDSVKPLLYTIAGNIIKNNFKNTQVAYHFESKIYTNETSENADSQLLTEEVKRKLEKAFAEIPEAQRVIFLMNRIEGLTYAEIAERLNMRVKAVERRMSETIKVIRSRIEFNV